jgi:Protein of unknown function with HXXEE motif
VNFDAITQYLARLTFREAVWLFPVAFTLHVLEEWAQFPVWAHRYASMHFTRHDYVVIHVAGLIIAWLFPVVLRFFTKKPVVFVFFALVFTPAVCFNVLFHVGATAVFGVYCPGLLTALTLYPPLFSFVSRLAYREGLLNTKTGLCAFVLAGVFHTGEVAHNVFKVW